MRKLPARYMAVVMPFLLSVFMSSIISFVATERALGFVPGLFSAWLKAWGVSWAIAFPTVMVVLPIVRRIAAMIVESPSR